MRFEHGEPVAISVEGESHTLTAEDLELVRRASGALVVKETGGFFVALDPTVTPALARGRDRAGTRQPHPAVA